MLKKIKIIDNFLDKEVFKKLQSFLLGDNCPWFYNESKASGGYQHQFTHTFLGNKLNPSWSNSTNHICINPGSNPQDILLTECELHLLFL